MPCYSSVQTKLKNKARIFQAAAALGLKATAGDNEQIWIEGGLSLYRSERFTAGAQKLPAPENTFEASGSLTNLRALSKQYAEIGIREIARKRGFSVTKQGEELILVRR